MVSTRVIPPKNIVIVGATSGLGRSLAYKCAESGHNVVLAGRRVELLKKIAEEIDLGRGSAIFFEVDVRNPNALEGLFQLTKDKLGSIDVIIYCSGVMKLAPLSELRIKEWIQMTDVNYLGALRTYAASMPFVSQQTNGHYVFVSSVAGHKVATPDGTVYSATKFALRAFAEGVRQEHIGKVRVTVVCPGAFESELLEHIDCVDSAERLKEYYFKHAVSSDTVAGLIVNAIETDENVSVNEIVVRPSSQNF